MPRLAPWQALRSGAPLPNVAVRVLLNPASGSGRALRRWTRIEPVARDAFANLVVEQPDSPGALRNAACRAAEQPGLLLAAGGDGTSHLVINGLLAAGSTPLCQLGWLPLGSGNDIARVNRVPLDPLRAVYHYRDLLPGVVDVGLVRYRNERDQPEHRYFGNSFTLGVTAHVLQRMERVGKPLGGRVSYFGAALAGLATHQALSVEVDGVRMAVRLVSITNGPSFGAGMRVAPMADNADGQLDLVMLGDISRPASALLLPKIYSGGHLSHPAVHHRSVRRVTIKTDGITPFEIDGELAFGGPCFEVEIVPGGLPVGKAPLGQPTR